MLLSPSTLSTIVAILSSQGVVATHSQVQDSLASLLDSPVEPGPLELQPGETVFVTDHHSGDTESFTTLEKAREWVKDQSTSGWDDNKLNRSEEDFSILIVRRQVNLDLSSQVSVTFS